MINMFCACVIIKTHVGGYPLLKERSNCKFCILHRKWYVEQTMVIQMIWFYYLALPKQVRTIFFHEPKFYVKQVKAKSHDMTTSYLQTSQSSHLIIQMPLQMIMYRDRRYAETLYYICVPQYMISLR
jgi:hypothetical protein